MASRRGRGGRGSPVPATAPVNRRPRAGQPRGVDRPRRGGASPAPLDAADAAVLRQRAEQLARQPTSKGAEGADVIVCRLRGERYAHRSGGPVGDPARSRPDAYPLHARLHRRRAERPRRGGDGARPGAGAGPSPGGRDDPGMVLLLHRQDTLVGLLVEDVLGIERLAAEPLYPATSGRDFVRGVADGTTTCLDVRLLLTDERFLLTRRGKLEATGDVPANRFSRLARRLGHRRAWSGGGPAD